MSDRLSLLRQCLSCPCKPLKFVILASFVWGLNYCRLLFSGFENCVFALRTCMQNAAADSIFYAVTLSVFTAVTDAWLPILCCEKHSLHLLICKEYTGWFPVLCLSNIISYWNKAASGGSVCWATAMVPWQDHPLSAAKWCLVKTQEVGHSGPSIVPCLLLKPYGGRKLCSNAGSLTVYSSTTSNNLKKKLENLLCQPRNILS